MEVNNGLLLPIFELPVLGNLAIVLVSSTPALLAVVELTLVGPVSDSAALSSVW